MESNGPMVRSRVLSGGFSVWSLIIGSTLPASLTSRSSDGCWLLTPVADSSPPRSTRMSRVDGKELSQVVLWCGVTLDSSGLLSVVSVV